MDRIWNLFHVSCDWLLLCRLMFLTEIYISGGREYEDRPCIVLERDKCSFTERHQHSCRISAHIYQITRRQTAEKCNIRILYYLCFSVSFEG